jgi:acyl-CoA dehydrogenase
VDFSADREHEEIIQAVDRTCAAFDDAYWSRCDQEHEFPWEFYDAMTCNFIAQNVLKLPRSY